MIRKLFLLFMILMTYSCYAAEDYYTFNSQNDKKRFELLTNNLRCLVCQNQNLASSNASLAIDLRDLIYQKIKVGQSDNQIIEFLVDRYSSYILYDPPFNFNTALLWFMPFSFLIFGFLYLFYYLRVKQ